MTTQLTKWQLDPEPAEDKAQHEAEKAWYRQGQELGKFAIVTWDITDVAQIATKVGVPIDKVTALEWLEANEDDIMDVVIDAAYKYIGWALRKDFDE